MRQDRRCRAWLAARRRGCKSFESRRGLLRILDAQGGGSALALSLEPRTGGVRRLAAARLVLHKAQRQATGRGARSASRGVRRTSALGTNARI